MRVAQDEEHPDSTAGSGAGAVENGSSEGQLEEVVVTAQKRKERTIDVPMSITAISGEKLTAAGITNMRDLSFAVPSLSVNETGPGRQLITLRGISGLRGTSSLIGVYLDELPVSGLQDGRSGVAYADLRVIDLDRVEVLKGPQGTLFGEGAAGGVIRFMTKDPDLSRLGGELSTELFNTAKGGWSEEVTGVVNAPLVKDVFGIRIAAKYENTSGWIDHPAGIPAPMTASGPIGLPSIGHEDINDSEVKHVRVKALYTPTSNLRISGMAEIHRNTGGASNIVNQEPIKDSNFLQAFDRNAPTGYYDDYDMFNLAVAYDFGFAEFVSSTSHAKLDSVQSETQVIDGEPVPWLEILVREYQNHQSITSQEFRFTSARKGPFNWTLGANYKDAELTGGYGDAGFDAVVGAFGYFVFSGAQPGFEPTNKSKSWAGFADASYEFFDRLEVGGGLRYFDDAREYFDKGASPITIQSADFSKTTFRAHIKYAISDDANVYFNAGNGFRSGGFNDAANVAGGAPLTYLPETTMSYELGAKTSLLNGRIRLDAAAFYTEYQDMIASRLLQGGLGYTANGQNAEVKGLEAELGWAATDRLTLSLAGDVTDTEITELDPTDPNPVYVLGDPISNVPKYGLSATADYRFKWMGSMPGFFQLSFNRKGKAYVSDRSNTLIIDRQIVSSELNMLNASVGGEWSGWNWSLFGRNLLDEDELIKLFSTGQTAQLRPRSVGIAIGKSF
jgi:outer membrane receptor protein involved in Fe transport